MSSWSSIMLFFEQKKLDKLRKYAEEHGIDIETVIHEAVDEFIKRQEERKEEAREGAN